MRIKRGYAPIDSIYPFQGLNTLDPSTLANPKFTPNSTNILFSHGVISKRHGYQQLGETLPVSEPVMALVEFEDINSTKHLVVVTTAHQYSYNEGSWTDITPAGGTWTGDETDIVDYAVMLTDAGKYLIITNGKDMPRMWDGMTSTMVSWTPNIPDFVSCKTVVSFFGHLIIGGVEAASNKAQTVCWGTAGSLTEFMNGTSGEYMITDSDGIIRRLVALGDRLIVYSDNSIHSVSYIGGDVIFSFEKVITQTRLVSARAIQDLGPFHLFMSEENIYLFDGTKMIRPIGDQICLSYRDHLYRDKRERSAAFLDRARNHIYWIVPTSDDSSMIYLLEYDVFDISRLKWSFLSYSDRPTCYGFFSRSSDITWDSVSMSEVTWDSLDMTWNQASTRKDFPLRVFGGVGVVFVQDDTSTLDGTNVINAEIETIDFTVPEAFLSENGRWCELELETRGGTVKVEYSVDSGTNWVELETLTLGQDWQKFKLFLDTISDRIRFKFTDSGQGSLFELRWLRAWVRANGV